VMTVVTVEVARLQSLVEPLASEPETTEEWSVVWTDDRMPGELRANRAPCRDFRAARSLAATCVREGLIDVSVERREVTATPWLRYAPDKDLGLEVQS
jgi:hypothetical protein